jgi:hypothetical protein
MNVSDPVVIVNGGHKEEGFEKGGFGSFVSKLVTRLGWAKRSVSLLP